MDGMHLFYTNCLESLYPPGSCGTFCNEHTYECYLNEVQESWCELQLASSLRQRNFCVAMRLQHIMQM